MDRKTLSREDRPDQDECRTPCFSRLRIVHNAYRIEITGESQRKRNRPPPLGGA